MSKNISNLSGRIGLKDNLFKQISENTLSDNPQDIKEIAKKHNIGVSTLHGAESFYEFLRPSHREKKAFVCNGSACMCAGTQDKLKDKLKEKLAFIENGTKNIESLKINYDKSLKEFSTLSKRLSNEREKAASILDKMIEEELKPLKMERARFKTAITQVSPNEFGQDSVTFTISTNSGSSFGALIKIASGGELSRFLLALKVCLTNDQKGASMVFDEIDRGVGGATADAVGRRLLQLAKKNAQVLVVTHSPQVAALAERHFVVSKVIDDDKPLSSVNEVKGEDCVEEIARMISGDTITDEAREASRVLISGASMS